LCPLLFAMRKRRAVLKGIGSTVALGATGVTSATQDNVKVIELTRSIDNPLSNGELVSMQAQEFASFVKGKPFAVGGIEDEEENVVGAVAAVNEEGQTRRYFGSTQSTSKVSNVHDDVHEYAQKFREEL